MRVKLSLELRWQKQHSARSRLFFSKLDLTLSKKQVKCCIWSTAGYWNWALLKVDQKRLESSEMWCWRTMGISWTDCGKNEVSYTVKEDWAILHAIRKKRKANRIGCILHRNCLLKHVMEGRIEVPGRRGRRRKQLLDDLKWSRGCWKSKDEALDRIMWRTRLGRGHGPVIR
jgi:hypothetical protein